MLFLTQKLENVLLEEPMVNACCCCKLGSGLTCYELVPSLRVNHDADARASCLHKNIKNGQDTKYKVITTEICSGIH